MSEGTPRDPDEPRMPPEPPAPDVDATAPEPAADTWTPVSMTNPSSAWTPPPAAPTDVPGLVRGWVVVGMFPRIAAFMLDVLVISNVVIIVDGVTREVAGDTDAGSLVSAAVLLAVDAAYFIGFWRSGWQGTLGMRLAGIRVLNEHGGVLPLDKAVQRWAVLSGVLWLIVAVPMPYEVQGLLGLGWGLALLISTLSNRRRRGLHDRLAGSVVGQPAGAAVRGGLTCLVAIALAVVYVVALPPPP